MDPVYQEVEFTDVYINNILVASRDIDSHAEHLCLLFQLLRKHGIVINVSKCKFECSTLKFLGHHIPSTGITPMPEKAEAITHLEESKQSNAYSVLLEWHRLRNTFMLGGAKTYFVV